METVTVSPKLQVIIPQKIRHAIGLRDGDKFKVVAFRNRIELLPMRAIRTLRGYLKGIDTSLKRDEARLRTWWAEFTNAERVSLWGEPQ
jgi:AbrB family looped-hinge helix DNA binding protein